MKDKIILNRFLAVFVSLIITLTSIASAATANEFSVDPLDPEWAQGDLDVDYTFEINNDDLSEGRINKIDIIFPDDWWISNSESCSANTLPNGWSVFEYANGICTYQTVLEQYMVYPGESISFIPVAHTADDTGIYEWNVQAIYTGGGDQPSGQQTNSGVDETDPIIGAPIVYSNNYYYDGAKHWVGTPFDLRAEVSDEHSGINEDSCEYVFDGEAWQPANYENVPPEYCYKEGIEVTLHNLPNPYRMRVQDNVGNSAQSSTLTLYGDLVAPETTDDEECPEWYGEDQEVNLYATDSGSGVDTTYYCVAEEGDICEPNLEGTKVDVTCSDEEICHQYIRYYSTDHVGNVEEPTKESCIINIDKKDPYFENIVFDPESPSNDNTPHLSFDVLDDDSGIDSTTLLLNVNNNYYYEEGDMTCTSIGNGYNCELYIDPLNEGTNDFYFSVQDNVGNSGSDYADYFADTVSPETEIGALPEYKTITQFYINYDFYDPEPSSGFGSIDVWYYSPDGGPYFLITDTTNDGNVQFSAYDGDGQYAFFSEGFDFVGNDEGIPKGDCVINEIYYESCPDAWTIIDTTMPELFDLNINYPAGQTQAKNTDNVIITVKATDANGIDVVYLDASNIGGSTTETMEFIGNDTYQKEITVSGTIGDNDQPIGITVHDMAGNTNSLNGQVMIDNTAPIISNIIFMPENPSNNPTPTVTFDVYDSDSGVDEFTIMVEVYSPLYTYYYPADIDCINNEGTWSCQLQVDELEEGAHQFNFYAEDHTGNLGMAQDEYIIDLTGPIVYGVNVNPSPTEYDPEVTAEALDELTNIDEARFYIDHNYEAPIYMDASDGNFDELLELIENIIDISGLELGNHLVEVQAKDEVGNWGELEPLTFIISEECGGNTYCFGLHPVWDDLWLPPKPVIEEIESLEGDYSINNVLESIDGSYNMVYYHNGTTWTSYVPERPINDLLYMNNENNMPYWIRMLESAMLVIE